MKKNWLRGLLLGVSLALLLGGGVALAAMGVKADEWCITCFAPDTEPTDEQEVEFTITGLDGRWDVCDGMYTPIGWLWERDCFIDDPNPTEIWDWAWNCGAELEGSMSRMSADVQMVADLEDLYGEWTYRVWQEDGTGTVRAGPVEVSFLLAEECVALEEEFVPEPGSILLLGSGLAGLAGYATLRWRGRE